MKEVRDNDYNLNVALYVMPVEEEEQIDIALEFSELKRLEEYISQLTQILGD